MKDCDNPSSNDEQPRQCVPSSVDVQCASNGGFELSNGSVVVGKSTCRRRAASGGNGRCNDVNGSFFCHLASNGHLTAPRVEQPAAQPVAPLGGFWAAEHDGGAGWTVPTRVQILRDLANLCTFAGAILATLSMAYMWKGRYYLGMSLNVAASLADIVDGPIARSTPGRHPAFAVVGSKLDCYSDIVSHFVVPASLVMHISDLNALCTALAALYVCAGILRHSLFEVTGRCENGTCIYGMTSDYNVTVYVLAMHLLPVIGRQWMLILLAACLATLISASLTFVLRSRRFGGVDLVGVAAFNVSLCASCVALLLFQDVENFVHMSAGLFLFHVALAYPCYFRFVELNA